VVQCATRLISLVSFKLSLQCVQGFFERRAFVFSWGIFTHEPRRAFTPRSCWVMQLCPAIRVNINTNFFAIDGDAFGKFALGIFWRCHPSQCNRQHKRRDHVRNNHTPKIMVASNRINSATAAPSSILCCILARLAFSASMRSRLICPRILSKSCHA